MGTSEHRISATRGLLSQVLRRKHRSFMQPWLALAFHCACPGWLIRYLQKMYFHMSIFEILLLALEKKCSQIIFLEKKGLAQMRTPVLRPQNIYVIDYCTRTNHVCLLDVDGVPRLPVQRPHTRSRAVAQRGRKRCGRTYAKYQYVAVCNVTHQYTSVHSSRPHSP